ncbi:response regulator transcription factor [Limnohabitans curvus]|nr:response regulator transcription factor [Limnohabitans curvus]
MFDYLELFKALTEMERYRKVAIDLVLADPHPVVLDGLLHIFQNMDGFSVKSCATDAESALKAVMEFKPDVLITELILQNKTGLVLIEEIQKKALKTHAVVFTGACIRDVCKAIDLGVQGMVSKDKPKHVLAQCIQSVYAGKKWLDKDLTLHTLTHLLDKKTIHASLPEVLTAREMVVAKMVSEGLPNKKIAQNLYITEGTTKLHLHHIYQKLNCPGRVALALHIQSNGLN